MRRLLRIWPGYLLAAVLSFPAPLPAQTAPEGGSAEEKSSCIRCHSTMPGRLGDPVQQWRGSVHAGSGVGCHNCHGGDPTVEGMEAMSPARGFVGPPGDEAIPAFCGRCHPGVEEDYRASAHGETLGSGGPQCVTCHGNHGIQLATLDLINPTTCTQCHGFERAQEIKSALAQTEEIIAGLDRDIRQLHRIGMETEELSGSLFAVRNEYRRLFHSVEVPKVIQQTATSQARLAEIRKGVDHLLRTLDHRRRTGALVVGLLAMTTIVSWLWRRTYQMEEEKGSQGS